MYIYDRYFSFELNFLLFRKMDKSYQKKDQTFECPYCGIE